MLPGRAAAVLEGVIQLINGFRQDRLAAADVAQQPEFLLVADVREVPDQRGHQPRMLSHQFGVVQRLRQYLGTDAGAAQVVDDAVLDPVVVEVGNIQLQRPEGAAIGVCGIPQRAITWWLVHDGSSPRFPLVCTLDRPATPASGSSAGHRPLAVHRSRYPSTCLANQEWSGVSRSAVAAISSNRVAAPANSASSSRAVITAGGTVHHPPGWASMYRTSRCPRGLTWGNRVVRWYSRSSVVGGRRSGMTPRPSRSHCRKLTPAGADHGP